MKKSHLSIVAWGLFVVGCSHSIPTSDRAGEPNTEKTEDSVDETKPFEHRAVQTRKKKPRAESIELQAPAVEFASASDIPVPMPNDPEIASDIPATAPAGFSRSQIPPPVELRAEQEAMHSALSVVASLPPPPPPESRSDDRQGEPTP